MSERLAGKASLRSGIPVANMGMAVISVLAARRDNHWLAPPQGVHSPAETERTSPAETERPALAVITRAQSGAFSD
jgi:hypothetical protein